jgi:pimeloyl-ACP methyl ester carboxylesterase
MFGSNLHVDTRAKSVAVLVLLLMAPSLVSAQNGSPNPNGEGPASPGARKPHLMMEDTLLPALDPGIQIYVRRKHLAGMSHFTAQNTVLFVHGATYPAETSFDLPLDGLSWMDYIAQRGYDVYLMDVRGYGHSTRPPQMDVPPDQNPPFAGAETAVRDISAVVDYVLAKQKLKKLNLIGWSWGTTTMAGYTAANPDRVERLVLYAPIWVPVGAGSAVAQTNAPTGAYREVTRDSALRRWLAGVPKDKQAALLPSGWFDQWWDATLATDPTGSKQNPSVVRAPNGSYDDVHRFWRSGRPTYDPAKITVPVLLIQADWDHDTPPSMAQVLFPLLVNAPEKRYVMIGEGTHQVMMEKNRMELFREVQTFLDEGANASH